MKTTCFLVLACALASACDGKISGGLPADPAPTGGGSAVPIGGSGATGGGSATPEIDTTCDATTVSPSITLDDIAAEFDMKVFGKMNTPGPASCTGCHLPESHRAFIIGATGMDTFHQTHAAGLFKNQSGSLLSRMTAPIAATRMPQGQPAWARADLESLARIACMVQTYEARGGVEADEVFPPNLLTPWTGQTSTDYENTFINYVQLKAKVKAIFNDDWVRSGVDQFDKNIGLFGGVNFSTNYVEARAATAEFLAGLDSLAPDVCGKAASAHSGPFAGLTLDAGLIDAPAQSTTTFEAEDASVSPAMVGFVTNSSDGGHQYLCYTNCLITANVNIPAPGTYQITVNALASLAYDAGPEIIAQIGSVAAPALTFTNTVNYVEKTATLQVTTTGVTSVTLTFPNDAFDQSVTPSADRNVWVDRFRVIGPLGPGTGTSREQAARQTAATLYARILSRPASTTETHDAYLMVKDLDLIGTHESAWAGLCEALMRHPDFLFTRPPSFDTAAPADKDPLRLMALAQRLLGRPPTAAELTKLGTAGFAAVLDDYLASTDFRTYYMNRMQLRLESQGTPASDEPARLWTYLAVTGTPFQELLTGDYSIDAQFQKRTRPSQHGHTGLLTMQGYVSNKPGLPHYNYPARVMSGFMGSVFEVPTEVFDQRGTATATSTVDTSSICFQCHQILTPLATQRLKWADDGTHRELDEQGQPIDDSDRGLVATYPYKGVGIEAFSVKAVKKEAFIRRMINTQFKLIVGRDMRHLEDERVLYKQLWDDAVSSNGSIPSLIRKIAMSSSFQGAP